MFQQLIRLNNVVLTLIKLFYCVYHNPAGVGVGGWGLGVGVGGGGVCVCVCGGGSLRV